MAALSLLLIVVAAIGAAWASPVHVPALPYDALRGDDDAMRNDEAAQLVFAAQPPQLMSHDYSLHSASESAMAGKDAAVAAAGAVNNAVTGTTGSTGANDASPSLVRPFSPVDMVSLDRLGSLAVSPDGKRAVFTRWHYTPSSNQKSKSLWAVDLKDDGGRASVPLMDEAYPLTPAVDGVTDDEPVWTGGDEVVFLRSDPRKKTTAKVAQFHRLVVSEARVSLSEARVSSAVDVAVEMYPEHPLPLGVGNLKYSASGKYLTFTAEVYANEHSSMVGMSKAKSFVSNLSTIFIHPRMTAHYPLLKTPPRVTRSRPRTHHRRSFSTRPTFATGTRTTTTKTPTFSSCPSMTRPWWIRLRVQ